MLMYILDQWENEVEYLMMNACLEIPHFLFG